MPYKIGGGNHIQLYDKSDGRYSEQNKEKSLKTDLDNLKLVHKCGLYYGCLKFPFPIKGVHDEEYLIMFVEYVAKNQLYEYAYIDDNKLNKYLFIHKDKDDKSKFMIDVLEYSNDEKGWNDARKAIIEGAVFSKMIGIYYTDDYIKVSVESHIKNIFGKQYKINTLWELKSDFTLRFITLVPGGKKMIEEYSLVRTKIGKSYSDVFMKNVYIPAGVEAYVVDKYESGYCIIEFVDHDAGYPTTADYMEDELEMVEED